MIPFEKNKADFDDAEPLSGHQLRFEKKLDKALHSPPSFSVWTKIAASILFALAVGSVFYFTTSSSSSTIINPSTNAEESFPIEEAESYYEREFDKQFTAISNNYTDKESKEMINESQLLIADLRMEYKELEKELEETGNYQVATAMILNYKSRISILKQLIEKLEYVNQLKNTKNEKINA